MARVYGQDPAIANSERLQFILADTDGREVYTHGVAVAPAGVSEDEALATIQPAYETAKSDHDEWTYADVIYRLRACGFEHRPAGVWVEGCNGV